MRSLRDQYPARKPPEGAPAWAVTYGDLMTILLVFFVLIASYSNFDVIKYRNLVGSVQTALGTRDRSLDNPQLDSAPTQGIASAAEERERRWVEEEVDALVAEIGGPLSMLETSDGTRVRINGEALFSSGEAKLLPLAEKLLEELAPTLRRYPYEIKVEGHTDNRPISTATFPSNWELSAARAASVVRHLRSAVQMRPQQLAAIGYADTRPAASNESDAGRAENRRVEMLLSVPNPSDRKPSWIRDPIGKHLPSPAISPNDVTKPSDEEPAGEGSAGKDSAGEGSVDEVSADEVSADERAADEANAVTSEGEAARQLPGTEETSTSLVGGDDQAATQP